MARDQMAATEKKMKLRYDKDVVLREFKSGDLVLAFLPVHKSPLQVRFYVPFEVKEKVGDVNYIIKTTGRRKSERKVLINLIKKYHSRESDIAPQYVKDIVKQGNSVLDIQVIDVDVGKM